MPFSRSHQTLQPEPVSSDKTAVQAVASVPAFSLEDASDSDDSVHQFLHGGQLHIPKQGRGFQNIGIDSDEEDEDEDFLMMGSSRSPQAHGTEAKTRPPSPRRLITNRPIPFRSAASEPSATASPSGQRRPRKKRQTASGESEDPRSTLYSGSALDSEDDADSENIHCDSVFYDNAETAALAKRRRMAAPAAVPLGDASNLVRRSGGLTRCLSEQQCRRSGASSFSGASPIMDTARIDKAIASIDSLNLIGNSEQGHALPTVKELDFGIRYVTPGTVSRLLAGHFADRVPHFDIVDCRYPYEYQGGHIRGAVNLFRPEELLERMLKSEDGGEASQVSSRVIIFHCEFSSERAPRMARLLRQRDREINSHNYPQLHYPELYLLQGGYKAFYEAHQSYCDPSAYTRMADPEHKEELAHFHRLGKAWERQNSRSKQSRLQKMVGSPLLM